MSEEEKNESTEPLGAMLDAWEAQAPPADFAERVLARARDEDHGGASETAAAQEPAPAPVRRLRARRWGLAGGGVAALALAAAIALRVTGPPSEGQAVAQDRVEVTLGSRARAVLEKGAAVEWKGDDVVQSRGDVFYRVEPGARFRVHTPAGVVEVKGTCFAVKVRGGETEPEMWKRDLKAGTLGAGLTALAFVAVYEGKVAASSGAGRVELAAGESAGMGPEGVRKASSLADGEQAFEAKAEEARAADPVAHANENLVEQVREYKKRLEAIAEQKSALEAKLEATEQRLASQGDGAAPKAKSEFDLSPEDWAELAKKGSLAYRVPCDGSRDGWMPPPEKLQKLGLSPDDGPVIKEAYARNAKRVWAEIGPICTAALGGNKELAEKLGTATCQHLVYDVEAALDKEAAQEAMVQVAEIRAGLRPAPGPNEKAHPVLKMFLALTGANKAFEQDLAQSFGPEEAHRLAFSPDMCSSDNRWGGRARKK